eukprot:m51a1_g12708 putative aspartyl-trna (514) ;mRNA; f:1522-3469
MAEPQKEQQPESSPAAAEEQVLGPDGKPLSKSALKKLAAKQKKAEAKASAAASRQQASAAAEKEAASEAGMEHFTVRPLNMSQERPGRSYTQVRDLTEQLDGQTVHVIARVHSVRAKGNIAFLVLRQSIASVQAVAEKGENVPKGAIKFIAGITSETIVEVEAKVVKATVLSATQKTVELHVQACHVISSAEAPLPVQLEDISRPQPLLKAQKKEIKAIEAKIAEVRAGKSDEELAKPEVKEQLEKLAAEKVAATKYVKVNQDTRLNNRVLDLRTVANQAIFRLQSAVGMLFREYLYTQNFVEIHTPKLIGAASEGGANVFRVQYFKTSAFLAQSPQLYKQMAVVGDLERVFEVAPVFRAEDSNTRRHLTEFMGLDLEMALREHYHEAVEVLSGLLGHIFHGLATRFAAEVAAVGQQYPVEPLVYDPIKRLEFPEAVQMLREDGQTMGDFDDLSTALEIRLGQLVKAKYHTDIFILDKFPAAVRPFYTMPDPNRPVSCPLPSPSSPCPPRRIG